jgi:Carboxypeptidase regulatory-like domain
MLSIFKPLRTLRVLIASAAACALMACGGGGGSSGGGNNGTPPAPAATLVGGLVQDGAGAPLAGATVAANGLSVTTGADGSYTFSLDSATTTTVVLVKKTGYTTTAKELPIATGKSTQMNIQMFADQVSKTFSGAATTSIPVNGATVTIPANSLRLAGSGDYTGTVVMSASYYSPDTVQGVQAFAGPYTGINTAGVTSSIISMGFIEVKLTDPTGRPLQLKIGAPATLTFPASSNSGNAASVPLWFYDETAKVWKNEGSASRQANGSYQGSVAHFTIWNADFFGVSATIKGCFRDAAGQPVADVGSIGIRGTGYVHVLRLVAGDTSGNFTINLVPANMPLELYSAASPAGFSPVAIPALAPGEIRTLSGCITSTVAAPGATSVTAPATVFTTTAASFAGSYTGTYGGAETGTFNVTINTAGVVTGSSFSQTYNQTFAVNGQIAANGSVTLTASGTAGSAQFSGSVAANGTIAGTWFYTRGLIGGGVFQGQRTAAGGTAVSPTSIDQYVGTWVGCNNFTDGTSDRETTTFVKSSASSLTLTDVTVSYNGAGCTGVPTGAPTTQVGVITFAGTKLVGAVAADKLIFTVSNPSSFTFNQIIFINGSTMKIGETDIAPGADGFPNSFDLDVLTKQ